MSDCDFFIAPYNTTPQLAQFFKEELVNVVFGSPKLLSYKHIAQAIVDFHIQKGTFTFVDRNDLILENECETIADYFFSRWRHVRCSNPSCQQRQSCKL